MLRRSGRGHGRDAVEIDQGEKIDGVKNRIDGGRAAEVAGDFEVGAKLPRHGWLPKPRSGTQVTILGP